MKLITNEAGEVTRVVVTWGEIASRVLGNLRAAGKAIRDDVELELESEGSFQFVNRQPGVDLDMRFGSKRGG